MVWPALIAAGAAVAGGLMSKREAAKQSQLQRQMAEQGVRMRVADAKAAGISPLAALGMQSPTYSPVVSTFGQSIADAGQDIGRAFQATRDQREREWQASQAREAARQLAEQQTAEHKQRMLLGSVEYESRMLDNEMRRLKLRREMSQVGPPFPGQAESFPVSDGRVRMEPSKQIARDPAVAGREASVGGGKPGFVPYKVGGNRYGFTLDVPSSEFGEGLEGAGPAAWLLGAAGIGGHYGSRFLEYMEDEARAWLRRNPPQFRARRSPGVR